MNQVINLDTVRKSKTAAAVCPDATITPVRIGMRPWDISHAEELVTNRKLSTKAAAVSTALAETVWMDQQRARGVEILLREPDGTINRVRFADEKESSTRQPRYNFEAKRPYWRNSNGIRKKRHHRSS